MKAIFAAAFALGLASQAQAQTQSQAQAQTAPPSDVSTSPAPAAVNTNAEPSRTTQAPVAGANSFTETQARTRLEERGYARVVDLKMDEKGVWRATAMKDGKSVPVSVDYQGNIVGQ